MFPWPLPNQTASCEQDEPMRQTRRQPGKICSSWLTVGMRGYGEDFFIKQRCRDVWLRCGYSAVVGSEDLSEAEIWPIGTKTLQSWRPYIQTSCPSLRCLPFHWVTVEWWWKLNWYLSCYLYDLGCSKANVCRIACRRVLHIPIPLCVHALNILPLCIMLGSYQ